MNRGRLCTLLLQNWRKKRSPPIFKPTYTGICVRVYKPIVVSLIRVPHYSPKIFILNSRDIQNGPPNFGKLPNYIGPPPQVWEVKKHAPGLRGSEFCGSSLLEKFGLDFRV